MHLLLALTALAGPAAPKVYEGEPAEGFPTAVNVGVSDGGALVSVCTGVLVTEDAVVTAAHCLEELDVFSAAGLIPEVAHLQPVRLLL